MLYLGLLASFSFVFRQVLQSKTRETSTLVRVGRGLHLLSSGACMTLTCQRQDLNRLVASISVLLAFGPNPRTCLVDYNDHTIRTPG